MPGDIKELLGKLQPADVTVDTFGRVLVKDPKIRDALKELSLQQGGATAADGNNYGCCTNGYGCHKQLE